MAVHEMRLPFDLCAQVLDCLSINDLRGISEAHPYISEQIVRRERSALQWLMEDIPLLRLQMLNLLGRKRKLTVRFAFPPRLEVHVGKMPAGRRIGDLDEWPMAWFLGYAAWRQMAKEANLIYDAKKVKDVVVTPEFYTEVVERIRQSQQILECLQHASFRQQVEDALLHKEFDVVWSTVTMLRAPSNCRVCKFVDAQPKEKKFTKGRFDFPRVLPWIPRWSMDECNIPVASMWCPRCFLSKWSWDYNGPCSYRPDEAFAEYFPVPASFEAKVLLFNLRVR